MINNYYLTYSKLKQGSSLKIINKRIMESSKKRKQYKRRLSILPNIKENYRLCDNQNISFFTTMIWKYIIYTLVNA